MRRLCGLLAVGLFLVFVAGLAPHLVHHLFDDEAHAATSDCPFASFSERQPGAPAAATLPAVVDGAGVSLTGPEGGALPALAPVPSDARAPPIAS
jgi:hypothetical protein